MIIREINTDNRFATVTFDYDELRCLHNSLYEVSRFDDVEKDNNFNDVYAKIIELFALVKHCKIPEFELELMYKLFFKEVKHDPLTLDELRNTNGEPVYIVSEKYNGWAICHGADFDGNITINNVEYPMDVFERGDVIAYRYKPKKSLTADNENKEFNL